MIVLQTERLTLRRFVPEDLELLASIFADREMMRFYPEPFTRERTQRWIDRSLGLYAARGHGLWALLRRDDGLLLGDCGLVPQQIEGAELLEIGYHVRRDAWGHGYATEAALACRDYALSQLGAAQVCSIVDPENHASRRVAGRVHQRMRLFLWEKSKRELCLYCSDRPVDSGGARASGE